jgi:hypothetical protein
MIRSTKPRRKMAQRRGPLQRPLSTHLAIPPYIATSIVSRTFRFVYGYTGGPVNYNITPTKLCALQVIGTVANSTVVQLYEAVKVRKIEMWANSGSSGSMQLSCTFAGTALGIAGSNQTFSDANVGMTYPAHVIAVPSSKSQASQWQNGDVTIGTNTLFTLSFANTGTVGASVAITIDVHVALRMTSNARTSSASGSTGVATVVVGNFYHLALDNVFGGGSASNDLAPDRNLVTTS